MSWRYVRAERPVGSQTKWELFAASFGLPLPPLHLLHQKDDEKLIIWILLFLLSSQINLISSAGRSWFGEKMVGFVVLYTLVLILPLVRSVTLDNSPGVQIVHHRVEIISSSESCHMACEAGTNFISVWACQPSLSTAPSAPAHQRTFCLCGSLHSFPFSSLLMRIQSLTASSAGMRYRIQGMNRDVSREVGVKGERNERPGPHGRCFGAAGRVWGT